MSLLAAAAFLVGASAVDVTPKLCLPPAKKTADCHDRILLAGFGPFVPLSSKNRWAEGIHDPLWARTLAIQGADGQPVVLMSVDSPGITWKHVNPVRRQIEREFGIPTGRIVIHSTHAHSAPDAAGYWSTFMLDHGKKYTDFLRLKMLESAREAILSMRPARMRTASARHVACINPRTLEVKKDPDCNLPVSDHTDPPPGSDFDEILIQADHRDPIVRNTNIVAAQFVEVESGETIATFVNWNNHPDTMESKNRLITSDYPHYVRRFMEHKLGGISVYFVGTLGSQIGGLRGTAAPFWGEDFERRYSDLLDIHGRPVPELVREGFAKIRSTGYEVANEAVLALEAAPWLEGELPVRIETRPLDIRVNNAIHLLTGSVWKFDVKKKDRMKRYKGRCLELWGCVTSDLSVLEIGDIGMVTAPGEVDPAYFLGRARSVVDYGDPWGLWVFPRLPALAHYMPGKHRVMIGNANNYLSYLVHKADNVGWSNFNHPNVYEEQVTVGKDFGDDVGNALMEMLGSSERY